MIGAVKRLSLRAANTTAFSRFLNLLERVELRRRNLLAVLTYHRVDHLASRPNLYSGLISATPPAFARQMEYLAANYHVVSMQELLDVQRADRTLPPRSVMITFDDAYRDFAEHAWPVLKQYGLPVTLFVPTHFPDHPERTFWWDRLHHALGWTTCPDGFDTPIGRLPLRHTPDREKAMRRARTSGGSVVLPRVSISMVNS